MPDEEKEKFDEIAISKFMGKMMFSLSFSMVFFALSSAQEVKWLFVVGLVLFIGIFVFILIFTSKRRRFLK
jgi:Ca2+/Na+ antiporter